MSYCTLTEDTKYMKGVTIGSGKNLSTTEATACEAWADAFINGMLKTKFTGTIPALIVEIAEKLASSRAYGYLHKGQAPGKSDYEDLLRKEAVGELRDILTGRIELRDANGAIVPIAEGAIYLNKRIESRDIKDDTSIVFKPSEEDYEWEKPESVYNP